MQKHKLNLGELDLDSFEVNASGAPTLYPAVGTEDEADITPTVVATPFTIGIAVGASLAACAA